MFIHWGLYGVSLHEIRLLDPKANDETTLADDCSYFAHVRPMGCEFRSRCRPIRLHGSCLSLMLPRRDCQKYQTELTEVEVPIPFGPEMARPTRFNR